MNVGLIGCGAMGTAMAGHIVARGRDKVSAYDIDPERLASVAKLGARPSDSLADLARSADLFIVMVVSDAQVLAVAEEVAIDGAEGRLIAVSSTVRPSTMHRVADIVGAKGLRVIDAPVCFGLSGAKEGRLASLCGGATEDVERARDVLMAYSRAVHHIGPLGTGQLAKTVNNMLHWAHCVANYEALLLAKRFGLNAQKIREVLLQCPAANGTLAEWDSTRFTWPRKDLEIALELAEEGGLALPLYGQVDQLVKLLDPAAVRGLLYEDEAPYLGRSVSAMDGNHRGAGS